MQQLKKIEKKFIEEMQISDNNPGDTDKHNNIVHSEIDGFTLNQKDN